MRNIFSIIKMGLVLLGSVSLWAGVDNTSVSPRDEYRVPLTRLHFGFERHWLLCGPILVPKDENLDAGLRKNYLTTTPDEMVHPIAGMQQSLPTGQQVTWIDYLSDTDQINLNNAFQTQTERAVGYAYTRLSRSTAGRAVLAAGSDDGIRIWLNGVLVLDRSVERKLQLAEDQVEVDLQAGENEVLVKITQLGGGWGFALCLLELPRAAPPVRYANASESLTMSLAFTATGDGGELSVLPSLMRGKTPLVHPALVQVVSPGGGIVAERKIRAGDRARFSVTTWPKGPYEVRCRVELEENRRLLNHAIWFRGDPIPDVRTVIASAPEGMGTTEEEMVHRLLADYLIDQLGPQPKRIPDEDELPGGRQRVFSALMEYRENRERADGVVGADRPGGFVRLAYRDEIDGSRQFGRVFLPPDYTPMRKWPLIVSLHGKNEKNPDYLHWGNIMRRFDSTADRFDAIVLYPHGRGNAFYQGIGELDVLRVLSMVKERFSVDEDRVYLTGYSMGGAGTWHVGTHFPELFAALAPYEGGREYRATSDSKGLTQLTSKQLYRRERMKSSFVNAESLFSLPVLVNHGMDDGTVPVAISRYGVTLLRKWGYNVFYWEHPGKGHGDVPMGTEDAVTSWMLAQRRVAVPNIVRIRSGDLRTAAAYWVRIEQRDNPAAFMRLEAEVVAPNTIRLTTENVLQVTLSPSAALVDLMKPIRVLWNDGEAITVEMQDGRAIVSAPGYEPSPMCKRPGLDGPFSDLFHTPFAIVQGTISPDPEMQRAQEAATRDMVKRWNDDQHCLPRVYRDTELTQEEASHFSLLLIGGPEENRLAASLQNRLPIKIAKDEITIDGTPFAARDAALQMIVPSPLNGDRYLAIIAATSVTGWKYRGSLNSEVDFSIVDGKTAPALANGYFDRAWRLDTRHIEWGTPKK